MSISKHKFVLFPLVVVMMVACVKGEPKKEKGNEVNEERITGDHLQMPKKKSELNGWQGLKIKSEGPVLCKLIFPENYGLTNNEELMVLRKLANSNLDQDLDCVLQVNSSALNQIRFLAVKKDDVNAASMLLNPNKFGGFELDGELAEEYAGEYQLPVLEKSNNLNAILKDTETAEQLSDSLCSWVETLGEKEDQKRLKKVMLNLRKAKLSQLSNMLSSKCGRVLQ